MGCTTSKDAVVVTRPVQGVGQTERQIGKRDRSKREMQDSTRSSKRQISARESQETMKPPMLDEDGHLMPEEVVRRSSSSIISKSLELGTPDYPIYVEYAHFTQRGYYPEDPHKENQDDYSISPKFAGGERDAMFAVYDGHGKKGHDCARFVKKKLPAAVAKEVRQARVNKYKAVLKRDKIPLKGAKLFDPPNWPSLDAEEYKNCCRRGFLATNKDIHKSDVEDNISGTTAITASFHEAILSICNVGDSRAVLGHEVDFKVDASVRATSTEEAKEEIGEDKTKNDPSPRKHFPKPESLLAIPLSRDQTPYRKDERERVKLKGAAIMSIDQIEGKEEMHENWGDMVLGEDLDFHGDPPRVWVEGKDYPGTAFTRSIGDSLAESIGVTAEPEMLTRIVTSNDHLLVVASDGVFEFLTNQEVIDMCAKCESPIIACEKLVKESYKQWLVHENRTDDITVIVCFLTVEKKPPPESSVGTTEDLVELARSIYGNKPMRKSRGAQDNLSAAAKDNLSVAAKDGTSNDGEERKKSIFELGLSLFDNKPSEKTDPSSE